MSGRFAVALLLSLGLSTGCEGRDGDRSDFVSRYEAADGEFGVAYLSPPWRVESQSVDTIELRIDAELFGYGLDGSPPTHVFHMGYVEGPGALPNFFDIPIANTGHDSFDGIFDTEGLEVPFDTDGSFDAEDLPEGSDTETPFDDIDPDAVPDYLLDLDLHSPRDVGLAELRLLVDFHGAQVDEPLQYFYTASGQEGVVFQVILNPGIFVRSYYFHGSASTVRAVFASLFNLQTDDIARMARTISTAARQEGMQ